MFFIIYAYVKMNRIKIGIYGICFNEVNFIERCIESILNADEIIICDTGSTDGTLELLEKMQNIHSNLKVKRIYINPWRFDDARNCALNCLSDDIDICISIDIDELMEPGWYQLLSSEIEKDIIDKGKTFDRYNHRFKTIWDFETNNISEHWHERIHARQNYMWKLPVHEYIFKCDGTDEDIKWLKNLQMTQKPDIKKSRGSYLPLLQQSIKEDKKRWKTFSFLAGELTNVGKFSEAIIAIDQAIKLQDSDKAFLYYQLSEINKIENNYDVAIMNMMNACMYSPNVREYFVYLAQIYLDIGMNVEAEITLKRASKITTRTYGYEYKECCWDERFDYLVKKCKEKLCIV